VYKKLILFTILLLSNLFGQSICNMTVDQKITSVENGLLPVVLIAGEAPFKLEDRMKHYEIPGISIAIIKDYKIVWSKQYGVMDSELNNPVNDETMFNVGSLSKGIASLAVLSLVDEGKIDLQANVNDQLISWKVPENEYTKQNKVNPLLLMNHSGGAMFSPGIGYLRDNFPTNLQILMGEKPSQSKSVVIDKIPGTEYQYSNAGYSILQQLIIDVTGASYAEYVRERIFKTLNMQNSTLNQPLANHLIKNAAAGHRRNGLPFVEKRYYMQPSAAGGLWTNASDYAKYIIELQKSHLGKSNKIISTKLAKEMLSSHVSKQYGLGVFMREMFGDVNYFGHMGDNKGFFAGFVSHLTDGYGAVVLTNSQNGAQLIREITNGIAKIYDWKLYLPEEYKYVPINEKMQNQVCGRYSIGSDAFFEIKRDQDKLLIDQFDNGQLYNVGNGKFVTKFRLGSLQFNKDIDNRYSTVIYHFADELGRFLNDPVNCTKIKPGTKIPIELLDEGKIEEAISLYRKIKNENPDDYYISENRFNNLGYKYMGQKKYDQALAILKLNVEFYPESSNVYDSLAEAYMNIGEVSLAIEFYNRSLELNSNNTNAIRMIDKLHSD